MHSIRALFIAGAVTILAPMASQAQATISSTGGGTFQITGMSVQVTGASASASDNVKEFNADSLKALQKMASAKNPVVTINGERSTVTAFNKLTFATVASVELLEASDADVTFYGAAAKNGILRVMTKPKTAGDAKGDAKAATSGRASGMAFKIKQN